MSQPTFQQQNQLAHLHPHELCHKSDSTGKRKKVVSELIFLYCSDESMLNMYLTNCCCLPFQAQPMPTIQLPILRTCERMVWGCVYIWLAVPQDGSAGKHSVTRERGKRARDDGLLYREFASRSLEGTLTRTDASLLISLA